MKKIAIVLSISLSIGVLFSACNNATKTDDATKTTDTTALSGLKFDAAKTVTVDEMAAAVKANHTFEGNVTGTIDKVCQAMGCWANLKMANGEAVKIKFRNANDEEFFIDKQAAGKTLIAHGIGYADTTSVEELKHFATDEGKTEPEIAAIKEPKISIGFTANGVQVK